MVKKQVERWDNKIKCKERERQRESGRVREKREQGEDMLKQKVKKGVINKRKQETPSKGSK